MTETHAFATWFTQPNWSTAHRIDRHLNWTRCGNPIDRETIEQAPEGTRRCGQCERRRS